MPGDGSTAHLVGPRISPRDTGARDDDRVGARPFDAIEIELAIFWAGVELAPG